MEIHFTLFTILSFRLIPARFGCHPSDREALLNFSRQIQPNPWPTANESSDCCRWGGVRCAGDNSTPPASRRVARLELVDKGLHGTIPKSLGRLDRLEHLDLSDNALHGPIPEALFQVRSFREIVLDDNNLSGHLSPAIGNLSALAIFSVYGSRLSGTIPDVFHGLGKSLSLFNLGSNNFSGQLPPSLLNCSALQGLHVKQNSLTIYNHTDFSGLTNLEDLDLSYNQFPDGFPNSIFSCTKLDMLGCDYCNLQGEFPHQFSRLHALQYVSITSNNFTNIVAALTAFTQCPDISMVMLDCNFMWETIPEDASYKFPALTFFRIIDSKLEGSIPLWILKSPQLVGLVLEGNRLRGTIPPWIAQLKHIRSLNLRNNMLTGEVPEALTQPGSPLFVTNPHPDPLFLLETSILDLSNNLLHGTSWRYLGNLTHLGYLNLSQNFFSGSIPDSFSDMKELESLDLSSNNISGTIPNSLLKLTFLHEFDVSNNDLEGYIPNGGQFLTFHCSSFTGNPKLHLSSFSDCKQTLQHGSDPSLVLQPRSSPTVEHAGYKLTAMVLPFELGFVTGFLPVCWLMWHFMP